MLIIDGEDTTSDALVEAQRLYIGYDAIAGTNSEGAQEAGSATQKFSFLDQARTRDEIGSVTLTAQDWSGDTNINTHRDACKLLVGAVEVMLRGSPPFGPGDASMGGLVQWSQVTDATWYQDQLQSGAVASCVFKVSYFRRLTP